MGNPPLPRRSVGFRNGLRCCPLTRVPLPSHAAAAACPTAPVPPALRRAGLPRCPCRARLRIAPPSRARPRATACCVPHARLSIRPARSPARCGAVAVNEPPPFARDRDVALSALAARRPPCRADAAGHVGRLSAPSHAGRSVRQRRQWRLVSAGHCTSPSLLLHQQNV